MDVNVLLYAHREDAADHVRYRDWLEGVVNTEPTYGMSELVLSSFVRIVTSRRIFPAPTPVDVALAAANDLRTRPNCVCVVPSERHWEIFAGLCARANARGALVADAYLAALAIDAGCEWITNDRGFARFPGLRWRHPFDGDA